MNTSHARHFAFLGSHSAFRTMLSLGLAIIPIASTAQSLLAGVELRMPAEKLKVKERPPVLDFKSCPTPAHPKNEFGRPLGDGEMAVELVVNASGSVESARRAENGAYDITLVQPTIDAFSKCRFLPALIDGEPVKGVAIIQYSWQEEREERDQTGLPIYERNPRQMYREGSSLFPMQRKHTLGTAYSKPGAVVSPPNTWQKVDPARQARELIALQPVIEAWAERRDKEVTKLLEALADAGNSRAQYWSALYFAKTANSDQEKRNEAVRLATLSASAGNPDALALLAAFSLTEESGGHYGNNYPQALVYLNAAVAADSPHGLHLMANQYAGTIHRNQFFNGAANIQQDPNKAFSLYKRAAELGYVPSQIKLANAYLKGQGVEADRRQAYFWLKVLADRGLASAARTLSSNDFISMPDAKADKMMAEWNSKPVPLTYKAQGLLTVRRTPKLGE